MIGLLTRSLLWGMVLWVIGFSAGAVVVFTPGLGALQPVPGISANPAITVLAILLWTVAGRSFARRLLEKQPDPARAGFIVGLVWVATNIALDSGIIVVAMGSGWGFFGFAGIWLAYAILLALPVMAGRVRQANSP